MAKKGGPKAAPVVIMRRPSQPQRFDGPDQQARNPEPQRPPDQHASHERASRPGPFARTRASRAALARMPS